ncbi:MAG: hypothetical protein HC930_00460 [Hydrococcus sp. SU_1_0]|nr:hypothetical protein [Hydrococcus sp. SU_1_0]
MTNNLQTVEEASLNLTQAKISGSVSKLVRHAAHTKAVSDWLAMSRLGLYILIPMMITAFGGWFAVVILIIATVILDLVIKIPLYSIGQSLTRVSWLKIWLAGIVEDLLLKGKI